MKSRSPRRGKSTRCSRTTKRRNHRNSNLTPRNYYASSSDLDHLNEALRIHKTRRLKGAWKVVPKDSCEVYKIRRRREQLRRKHAYRRSYSSCNELDYRNRKNNNKKYGWEAWEPKSRRKCKCTYKRTLTPSTTSTSTYTKTMSRGRCSSGSDMDINTVTTHSDSDEMK